MILTALRLAVLVLIGLPVFGQPSAVAGEVTDSGGSPIESTVVCRQLASDFAVEVTTDGVGQFEIAKLPQGQYRLEVSPSSAGFLSMNSGPFQYNFPHTMSFNFILPLDFSDMQVLTVSAHNSTVLVAGDLGWNPEAPPLSLCFSASQGKICRHTNEFGQYYLRLARGTYRLVVSQNEQVLLTKTVDLSTFGGRYFVAVDRSELAVRQR
jgi:hypothetical protein